MSNVHFLQCSVVVIDGIKFAGCTLWSDSTLSDFQKINDGRFIKHTECLELHQKHSTWLNELLSKFPPTVITHHPPTSKVIHQIFEPNTCYYSNLEHLIESPVKLWISGHTHEFCDLNLNGVRLFVNPIGYRCENRFTQIFKDELNFC